MEERVGGWLPEKGAPLSVESAHAPDTTQPRSELCPAPAPAEAKLSKLARILPTFGKILANFVVSKFARILPKVRKMLEQT